MLGKRYYWQKVSELRGKFFINPNVVDSSINELLDAISQMPYKGMTIWAGGVNTERRAS